MCHVIKTRCSLRRGYLALHRSAPLNVSDNVVLATSEVNHSRLDSSYVKNLTVASSVSESKRSSRTYNFTSGESMQLKIRICIWPPKPL